MKNNTWQKPAIAPDFGMPIYGPSSHAARTVTCGDAVRSPHDARLDASA